MTTKDLFDEAELDYEAACRLHEQLPQQLLSIPTDEDLVRELQRRGAKRPDGRSGFGHRLGVVVSGRNNALVGSPTADRVSGIGWAGDVGELEEVISMTSWSY